MAERPFDKIDPDLWQRIDAEIRAEGRDPEAELAQAAANVEAWREHGKVCNGACSECKRAFEACVDWIVGAPEIAEVIHG